MKRATAGATMLEIVLILTILALMATLFVPLASGLVDVQRATGAKDELKTIYTAIVGDPQSDRYGYLGDVGFYPNSLMDLVQNPGVPGWNGPYLNGVTINTSTGTSQIYDRFGGAIEYFRQTPAPTGYTAPTPMDQLALISRGPDRSSTNTSSTPNQSSTFTGTWPSAAGYLTPISNLDNVVYPAVLDNANLAYYQSVGTLNVSINNYDENSAVGGFIPGCPGVYDIIIQSLTHPNSISMHPYEAWVTYAPGGASFDLLQGTYLMTVRMTNGYNSVWQEQISVQPGRTQAKYLGLPAVDSATTSGTPTILSTVNFSLANNETSDSLQAVQYGASVASATKGQTVMGAVRRCARTTVVDTSAGSATIDSFIMPNFVVTGDVTGAYTKHYTALPPATNATWILTVKNTSVNTLAIYDNGLLVGTVGMRGNKRVKSFLIQSGDTAYIYDDNNTQIATRTSGSSTYP